MRKFSLVLGGGSALGFAHIGVIQYLEEQGMQPSEILGTSMGALIGSMMAFGHTSSEMRKMLGAGNFLKLLSVGFGNRALINDSEILEFLREVFGEKTIGDADIALKIVATRLSDGKKKVFGKSVKVYDAIRASISVPGVFDPHKIDDVYYVDGYVSSNLPVEEAKFTALCVDVSRADQMKGFEAKWYRRIRNATKIGLQALRLMIIQQTAPKVKGKKVIRPDVSNFLEYDFLKYKALINCGYKATVNFFK